MGVKEIRKALKVDLEKPAWEQPGVHVRYDVCIDLDALLIAPRTAGIQMVRLYS